MIRHTFTLIAMVMAIGCSAATDEPVLVIQQECTSNCGTRGKSDVAAGAAEAIQGPAMVCHIIQGSDTDEFFRQDALECLVAAEPDFRLSWATATMFLPEDHLEEGRVEAVDTPVVTGTFVGNKYPMNVRINVDYVVTAVTPSSGDAVERRDTVTCEGEIASPADTIECSKSYERWELQLLPDTDLQSAWEAGEHRAATFDLSINPLTGEPGVRWMHNPRKGDVLAQSLTLILNPEADEAKLLSRVPYNNDVASPVTLLGPGVYDLHADGTLSLAANK